MKNEESPHTLGVKQVILHSSFFILHSSFYNHLTSLVDINTLLCGLAIQTTTV